jgi:hypothetical protein
MKLPPLLLLLLVSTCAAFAQGPAPATSPLPPPRSPHPPRAEWGAPLVDVSQSGTTWTIAGRKNTVTLNATDLAMTIKVGAATWSMVASGAQDIELGAGAEKFTARLADAGRITVANYDTGERTGVQITLDQWKRPTTGGQPIRLPLYLTVAFDNNEELLFTVAADESHGAVVRRLDWPTALDGREVDHTVLNHYRGILLPRNWPQTYNPIRGDADYPNDTSEIQSDVVECWSQAWWGFQKGPSAAMIIIETPDDAAYQWSHPAGGPTVIGPRWRAQLGKLGYPRSGRMVFFERGNYVDLAKRYREHAMETGLWVPLTAKIAQSPRVQELIGNIESRVSVLRNIVPESRLYNKENPAANYRLNPFDERARQMRELKASGIEQFNLVLTGWPREGYDREHPDGLPAAPAAGGWAGMKRLADTCKELGYLFTVHDQYRDYYVEAPSYNPKFAVHEEDEASPPTGFPGTRFGTRKEGRLAFLAAWDGGKQTYLSPALMFGHMKKNYGGILAQGIKPDGSYLDVFGYVPPDQDFNPEHPVTRTEAKREIAKLYRWTREHLGTVGTEAGVDWTVPYTDYSSPLGPGKAGIPVPLFSLVYHDAVMTPYSPGGGEARMNRDDRPDWLFGMINGGPPRVGLNALLPAADATEQVKQRAQRTREILKQMTSLHKRVALLAMTNHEFLDNTFTKERSTFADGTTVTVDWNAKTVEVSPAK